VTVRHVPQVHAGAPIIITSTCVHSYIGLGHEYTSTSATNGPIPGGEKFSFSVLLGSTCCPDRDTSTRQCNQVESQDMYFLFLVDILSDSRYS